MYSPVFHCDLFLWWIERSSYACKGRTYFYPFPAAHTGSITQQTVIVAAQPSVNGARQYQARASSTAIGIRSVCTLPKRSAYFGGDLDVPSHIGTGRVRCKGIIYSYPFPECAYGPPPALGSHEVWISCRRQQRTYRSSVLILTDASVGIGLVWDADGVGNAGQGQHSVIGDGVLFLP
ncbi:hypothetical protein BV898_16381 [Hypsibius exemplaris]|uniref:Uncharacterized protein n=1 Tax=Hypsibius exemplaris TaxID=2072580 RepID=A0A9X6RLS1_HYPEX|nr:hypothetical protein BV898_16381 [Hypsibius exemplaris]